ncbi:MAG: hypothetical protein VYC39_13130 [Myxococcota bacterium]|nr:hypothetical protein [Myxococcota bacterium]
MRNLTFLSSFVLFAWFGATTPSHAASKKIHFQQSQALINFSSVEARVLSAALSAREFDFSLTSKLASSLSQAVSQAKKHVDKTTDLLEDSDEKLRPKLEKLRKNLVEAERQLEKLEKDLQNQVKPYMDFVENDEGDGEAPPSPNWEALKKHVAWVAQDLKKASQLQRNLAGRLRIKKLPVLRKPKGSRN